MVQAEEMFSFLMHRTFPFQQDAMSDEALEALSASLGSRKPEPELDLRSIKEVDEVLTLELVYRACQSAGYETKCGVRV